ncbi:MAG: hypothetical protein KGL39_58595, partial [Patescibacteria group bacterium]|nr:hypothetical protein [Patescibacteria group bacterium]
LPGEPSTYTFGGGGAVIEKPKLKVIVRDSDAATAETLIGTIVHSLELIVNQTLSGTWYDHILTVRPAYQQIPVRDHKRRSLWAADFRVWKATS